MDGSVAFAGQFFPLILNLLKDERKDRRNRPAHAG